MVNSEAVWLLKQNGDVDFFYVCGVKTEFKRGINGVETEFKRSSNGVLKQSLKQSLNGV